MGLRAKFNLMLLGVALAGLALLALVITPILQGQARDDVVQHSQLMMGAAGGVRKYTSEHIAPLLEPQMATTFHPEAVSAFAAMQTFDVLHARYPDYDYREPALNPTNPADRATDWEADIINDFRAHPATQETVVERQTATGPSLVLARPIVAQAACLACHSTSAAAPKSMLAIYGPDHGFGWRENEVVAAQVVSVPMSVALAHADQARLVFLACYAGVFVVLFALLNLLLEAMVLRPIDHITHASEAVSLGRLDAPEYVRHGKDQVARLASAINRMRRSLQEALRMLSEP